MRHLGKTLLGIFGLVSIFGSFASAASAEWKAQVLAGLKNRAATAPVTSVPLAPLGSAEQISLGYDSGPALYFPQSAVAGSMWAVRFSPLQSCSVSAFSVFSAGGGGSVKVHIFGDEGGRPTEDLIPPFTAQLKGDLTNQVIYLPSSLDAGEGEFHVAFELLSEGAPFITGDGDGGSGHSSYALPGGVWSEMNQSDFTVRAFVRYYGIDKIPPQLVHLPPDAAFAEDELVLSAELSDFSGISEAIVHYAINGGAWNTALMHSEGELFEARLSSLSAGSTVRYFIEAKDGAASPNSACWPAAGFQSPFELPVYAGRQIKYDDGTAEDFFVVDYRFDDNRFAVRLSPETYPAQLHTLRAFVNDTAPIFFSVWSEAQGLPSRLLSGPWKAGLEQAGEGWVNFELPVGSRPIVEQGDFFLVVQWSAQSPGQPGIGADGALPDGRSFFYTGAGGWKSWVFNDWMLRASYVEAKAVENRPLKFSLEQNVPNPFNPSTEIRFRLEQPARVDLSVYNVLGQKLKTIASGDFPGGEHSATWDSRDEQGRPLSSGIYFYRLRSEDRILTRRMVLIK